MFINTMLPSRRQVAGSLLAGAILATLGASSIAMADDFPPPGLITTQGHGEVKVKPDSLSVSVTVQSKQATLSAAREDNNRKMQAVISALKGLNVPNLKLETQNLQVYPIQSETPTNRLPKIIGYQVTNSLQVTVTGAATDTLGITGSRIVDTALNAGANDVGGLNFYVDNLSPARQHALVLAVQDARRNAEAMATAAGLTLTGTYSLEGSPQYNYPQPIRMYSMAKAAAAPMAEGMPAAPVETGETTITSDVSARFKF